MSKYKKEGPLKEMEESRMKVKAALTYPVVMMFIGAAVVIFLLTTVIPQLLPIFESRETSLSMATQILIGSSNLITNNWFILLTIFLSLVFGLRWAIKQDWGRKLR